MKHPLIAVLLFLLLNSCNKTEERKENNNENIKITSDTNAFDVNNPKLKEELKKMILENDTTTYKKHSKNYITSGHSKEFLYYAILMAEKNNYSKAYLDIVNTLDFALNDSLMYNSKYASYCLLKAYEMGDNGAKSSINYIYIEKGKIIPKSSSIYNLK